MFKNLKVTIRKLAKTAVKKAEEKLGSSKGGQKKDIAIKYVIDNIPLPIWLKPFVRILLSSFIDDAIEFAVEYMEVL